MNTKALRQKILDLAIHGKLVPQDPNDEPASVLLQRIRAEKERLIKEGKIKRPKKTDSSDTPHYQNVPFEVPESWDIVRLEDICTFLSRGKSPKYSEERKYPVFAQKCNLKEGGISLDKALFLDPNTLFRWPDEYKLRTGDVLINSTGTGTVGRTRYFNETVLGEYPFVVPDSHVSVVRTATQIESKYVYAVISSQLYQQYLEDNLAGSTNQKELYIGVLADMEIPIPPYKEQHRIVAEIEKWFALIAEIEAGQEDLSTLIEQTKSKILDLAIHGKLVPQDPADEPAIDLLRRINPNFQPCDTSRYGKLPQGWCECRLEDISTIIMGQSPDGSSYNHDNGIEFHQGKIHFTERIIGKSDVFTTEAKKIAPANANILCVRAPVGIVNITNREIAIGRGLCALIPKENIDTNFLFSLLQAHSQSFCDQATGSTFKAISVDTVKSEMILLPPLAEQQRIVNRITELFYSLDSISQTLAD